VADEILIAVDEQTRDGTKALAARYGKTLDGKGSPVFDIKSPIETGFDVARNTSIERAQGDWILWIDYDEVLHNDNQVYKYLKTNQFSAYAVAQHHFSVFPPGVMRTDYPTRLFRNRRGVQFFGVVHEHPETAINEGAGKVMLISDVSIAHFGYHTEDVRRQRFQRNIELLVRDREKYPQRNLGKFLWLRDLAQMCQYEAEANGGRITPLMHERARMGIALWEELLASGELRMIVDAMDFYTTLSQILGDGFAFGMKLDTSKMNGGLQLEAAKPIQGVFASRKHVNDLVKAIIDERTKTYESKYY